MDKTYNKLKRLSEFKKPTRSHSYKDYIWIAGGDIEIPLINMSISHLRNCYKRTCRANWTDIYAGHLREEWVKAFNAEYEYKMKELGGWAMIQCEIKRLKKANNR